MKNIKAYMAGLAVMTVCSCSLLDEKVFSTMTSEEYFKNFSESDIPAAVGVIYSDLRLLYAGTSVHSDGCWLYTNEETSDCWVTPKRGGSWYDGGIYYRLNGHTWKYDDAHIQGNWTRAYTAINDCNRLIYQFADLESKDKDALMAEIRIGRAFWYYVLCDMYGNVPISTRYDVPDGYLPETSSRQEVFDFIISEINDNIDLLPLKSYGRWDKYSTSCLLAKMYINASSWGIDTGDIDPWDKTVSLCDEIINSGRYRLENDYKAPFVIENENSVEIIMACPNDEVYHNWSSRPWTLHLCTMHWKYRSHANTVTEYWGGCCATPEFALSYDPDDLRYEKSWFEGQLYDNLGIHTGTIGAPSVCDPWEPTDKGKLLVHTKEIPLYDGYEIPTTGEGPGVRMQKYEIRTGCLNSLGNDFVLFRYADVLFMKAEALYRKSSGATQEVCDLINSVRERAFAQFTEDKKVKAGELDDNRFLQEYAWEFCQEGYRRQQLIRFNQFTSRKWFLHDSSDDYRKLFPVPRAEMLANPNLKQNEGYESPVL
ncbi:MAG: RagB/SusD family nutrient uptake outer membrane protein [Bacteroidales bacterium]|nr:RagB/SusD family nutrient uptake outer membrane protein [Bacteroidales bacterium]